MDELDKLTADGRCYFLGALESALRDLPQDNGTRAGHKQWARGTVRDCVRQTLEWQSRQLPNNSITGG